MRPFKIVVLNVDDESLVGNGPGRGEEVRDLISVGGGLGCRKKIEDWK